MEGNGVVQDSISLSGGAGFKPRFFRFRTHLIQLTSQVILQSNVLESNVLLCNITEETALRRQSQGERVRDKVLTLSLDKGR